MFLFIGESIGFQELIFIGVIALIVFGPRKLPQMARTIGKVMADFRRTTNDFKETWQKEVDFEEFKEEKNVKTISKREISVEENGTSIKNQIAAPEIREVSSAEFEKGLPVKTAIENTNLAERKAETDKQSWL